MAKQIGKCGKPTVFGLLAALLLIASAAPATHAASYYSFDQALYTVQVGQTVPVPVYLTLTGDEYTAASTYGLASIGVRMQLDALSPLTNPGAAYVAADTDVSVSSPPYEPIDLLNPFVGSTVDYASAYNVGLIAFTPFGGPDVFPTGEGAPVLIGTYTFTGDAIGTSIYDALRFDPEASWVATDSDPSFGLDPSGSAQVAIQTLPAIEDVAAPTPTTAAAGAGLLALLAFARRAVRTRAA